MLSPQIWLQLDRNTRIILAKEFGIPKTGNVEVIDNRVACDGHTVNDLSSLTIEKLKLFTNNNSDDFYFQFNKVVNFIEGRGMVIENKDIEIKDEKQEQRTNSERDETNTGSEGTKVIRKGKNVSVSRGKNRKS